MSLTGFVELKASSSEPFEQVALTTFVLPDLVVSVVPFPPPNFLKSCCFSGAGFTKLLKTDEESLFLYGIF